ncbi:outer membrane beta-barrel protein [Alcanivorax sp. DP30]|uniref:outer membrane beta-barrel protein n=1 Tax=Alcanivorax sp. DP30 TaxID=2606217 RepID=UPI00136BD331|nr:outer membrane beta-barrel protein [Alcanivorax sp. DP30]MZR62856.1 outer membrane beta-barrel protein [Alcanivorax sp. DP30]
MKRILVMGVAMLAAGNVFSAEEQRKGAFMVGAEFVKDKSNYGDELEDALLNRSGPGFSVDDEGAGTGTGFYLGYAFGAASSVRLGYRTFGNQDGEVFFSGVKASEYKVDADGAYLAVDLMYPINKTFSLGGTLGLQSWDGDISIKNTYGSYSDSSNGRDFFYGLRGKAKFNEDKAAFVVGYSLYSFEDEEGEELEYNSFSLGLEGYFR